MILRSHIQRRSNRASGLGIYFCSNILGGGAFLIHKSWYMSDEDVECIIHRYVFSKAIRWVHKILRNTLTEPHGIAAIYNPKSHHHGYSVDVLHPNPSRNPALGLASPDGWPVWGVVMYTRWWLLVDHCVLRNWDRILVRAVKGLISHGLDMSITVTKRR